MKDQMNPYENTNNISKVINLKNKKINHGTNNALFLFFSEFH